MRVLYVANHDAGGNEDEAAIAYALRRNGCTVLTLHESDGPLVAEQTDYDFLLCHKWHDNGTLGRIRKPKVCWYFDLVEFPDPELDRRNAERRSWMARTLPLVDVGFCTDGDWVAQDTTGKLAWLPQGFDSRLARLAPQDDSADHCNACGHATGKPDILYTGLRVKGGAGRRTWVDEMTARWGGRFCHILHGCHGQRLLNAVRAAQVVVCPDAPVTDAYWSNRIYLMTGFGGCVLHPETAGLRRHFADGEIIFYRGRSDLHAKIDACLAAPAFCRSVAAAGHARTLAEHTYRQRVAELLRVVQTRLF